MPVRVFSEEEKEEIVTKMFEAGMQLIREYGLTHASVTKITNAVGIGKSTFYNFFESKEIFVINLIRYEREKAMKQIADALDRREKFTKEEGKSLFRKIIYSQDSIYQYLTDEDVKALYPVMKESGFIEDDLNSDTPQYLLSIIEGVRKDADPKVFVNFLRILALCEAQSESLHEDVLQQNIDMIFDKMFEYVFEE